MSGVAPRWDVASAEALQALLADPLPLGLRAGPARRSFVRDLYFDTAAGDLRRRDVACRVRFAADDRRTLVIEGLRPGRPVAVEVAELDPAAIFAGGSGPARRLRALVDPARLVPSVELETERRVRLVRRAPRPRPPARPPPPRLPRPPTAAGPRVPAAPAPRAAPGADTP